jgi:hypothetical protein
MNHKNVIKELPHHLTDPKVLITIRQVVSVVFDREKVRGTDYRRTLMKLTAAILGEVSQEVQDLFLSLIEMTKVFYAHDNERCPRHNLWLYNLSWLHSKVVSKVLCPPKALTDRKLFGIYYHTIIDHAPIIQRILCLQSIMEIKQSVVLITLLTLYTKKNWTKQIEDLAANAFLHIQAEEELTKGNADAVQVQEREIKKLASNLPKLGNLVVKRKLMLKGKRVAGPLKTNR